MSSTVISIVCSLLSCLCTGGACFLVFILILGFIMLRRRGKKAGEVTAKEAFDAGIETATGVFRRNQAKKDAESGGES